MNIVQKTSTVHTGYLKNRPIKYIVLHYTAGTKSTKGVARNVASMFANPNNRAASADFIVDDGEIVQYNGDIRNRYTYAVGGAKYSVRYTSLSGVLYGQCKNSNSISIEMCSTKVNTKSLNAADTDWSLTASVVDNAVELTKYLMKKYNVPADRVIMHHHVNGKACPQPWCLNEKRLQGWYQFKARLTGAATPTQEVEDMTKAETTQLINEALAKNNKELLAKIETLINKSKSKTYNDEKEIPDWYKDAYNAVKDVAKGKGDGLAISEDMLRILTYLHRMGKL